MKAYRYRGKGFRTFKLVGYALLWVSAVILCAVVWDILLETSEREMENRRDALVAKGFISRAPGIRKKINTEDCRINKDDTLTCIWYDRGEMKTETYK